MRTCCCWCWMFRIRMPNMQLKTVVQVLSDIGCEHIPTLLVLNKIDALENPDPEAAGSGASAGENADALAFWKSVFPDALPASALAGEGIAELTEMVREQMLGQTLRAQIAVPLSDAKGITFIEKFSQVEARDYESKAGAVLLTALISQRIVDQLVTNVPAARLIKSKPVQSAKGAWRCRTKPVKHLLPEGFLETANGTSGHAAREQVLNGTPARAERTGITHRPAAGESEGGGAGRCGGEIVNGRGQVPWCSSSAWTGARWALGSGGMMGVPHSGHFSPVRPRRG